MLDLRPLDAADAADFRAIRLEALAHHPCAFAATVEEEVGQTLDEVAQRLAQTAVFGAFVDGDLAGTAGFVAPGIAKKRHKGVLWGVYVRERMRGRGLGRTLVDRVIRHARAEVEQLHATVVVTNRPALGLYRSLGFRTYGIEPRGLKVAGRYFDQELMVLLFPTGPAAGQRS